jgi:hypothetical protein
MILNSYAILTLFVGLIRLLVGVLILTLGIAAWRRVRAEPARPDGHLALEQRGHLVFLLALLLIALNVLSWPLLYLLLQSYIPEWPGIMCLYGVTRIGTNSLGSSRYLPGLLSLLQLTKPALVFVGGLWFVLYLLNRRTATAALVPRLFAVLLPLGSLAVVDAVAEFAYVVIPKKEVFPSSGCCTEAFAGDRFVPSEPLAALDPLWLWLGFYGSSIALILALFFCTRSASRPPGPRGLLLLLAGGLAALLVGAVFLVDVAAPRLLGLPYHHCPYDLIGRVPESIVAMTLFIAGTFALGWAALARWLGHCPETDPLLPEATWLLLRWSLYGHVAGLVMLSLELSLA